MPASFDVPVPTLEGEPEETPIHAPELGRGHALRSSGGRVAYTKPTNRQGALNP